MPLAGAVGRAGSGLRTLLNALNSGSDTRPSIWQGDDVALGGFAPSRFFWPLETAATAVLLDGDLHYQNELSTNLEMPPTASAAALLAAAYDRWGLGLLDRIAGDFACAIWDGRHRRLMLFADPMSMRPLFFWQGADRVLFASTTRALHAERDVPRQVDLEQIAAVMAGVRRDGFRSDFTDIQKIGSGYVAIMENGHCRQDRWWRPEQKPLLNLASPKAYAEAVRETLDQAVGQRLPQTGGVGITMSGGLDSTAVAALAARRLARHGKRLTAITCVPAVGMDENPGQRVQFNEGALAGEMAKAYSNVDHVLLPNELDTDFFQAAESRYRHSDVLVTATLLLGTTNNVLAEHKRRGCSVVMTGGLGNHTVSYHGLPHLGDMLTSGNIVQWLRLLPGVRQSGKSWPSILNFSMGHLLPPKLRAALLRAKRASLAPPTLPFRAEFLHQTGLQDEINRVSFSPVRDTRAYRVQLMHNRHRGPHIHTVMNSFGLTPTDPTSDRRVVELCLSIPEGQFIHNGQPRSLIRLAMRGIVPDAILDSKSRGQRAADWPIAYNRARPQIMAELARIERSPLANHCLDLKRMRQLADNWPTEGWERRDVSYDYAFFLARGLMLGHFLRRFEGGNE